MISLEEFMASEKPKRRSKLDPFKDDILALKQNGYSERSIVKYLELNGLIVSQRTVNQFILNNKPEEKATPKIKVTKNQTKENKESKSSSVPRSFDWQTKVDESELI
ncbi:hypothetical protein [Neisseria sp. Ec49-e6-T10]|uniref:hypothetical protein n=1 Tax=Neisseria sp. Ec49-e6-T10 TaxID=3140744 RepID=UPI003EC134C4